MNEENFEPFWVECEQELEKYTLEFNTKMKPVGFHVEYIVVDRKPNRIGLWIENDL